MITKAQFEIAQSILDLGAIYINGVSEEMAFELYEISNGDLEFMEKTLDLAVDNFVESEDIIAFFEDAVNGPNIGIDERGQYLGFIDPRN